MSNDEIASAQVEATEVEATAGAEAGVDTAGDVEVESGVDTAGDVEVESGSEIELPDLSDPARLRAALEAILFVVESPVSATQLATAVQLPLTDVELALSALARDYDENGRGIELRRVGGGVRIYTRSDLAGVVEAFLLDGQRSKLSQAALETLAVVAYRQPVTRARISAIRGVNVDGVVRTLTSRGLIVEVGADPETGGGLYRTTDVFLERMGLDSIAELPSLAPLLPDLDT
ncbi:MAG TPA: SMC-Scp complex subunit ScpB, partial [Jatrophihabitantaceae bacterium]|nr:SMC-Scp complex subunit ScpB [Jatrophihabitantaceae bacterium]